MEKSCINDFKKSSNSDASKNARSLYSDSTADTARSASVSAVVSKFQIQSDNSERTQGPLKDHSRTTQGPFKD